MRLWGKFAVTAAWFLGQAAWASNVAIVDSGVDIEHRDLAPRIWSNPGETAGNSVDDDGNGFVDDVHGWNFADGTGEVLDRSLLGTFSDDCYKYFAIQGRILRGTASDEDQRWMTEKKADETFMANLEGFANFVHGSHVSGIASQSRSTERLIAVKIISTKKAELLASKTFRDLQARILANKDDDPLNGVLVKFFLDFMAQQNSALIAKAFDYAAKEAADVANGSFGVSSATAAPVIKQLLSSLLGHDPSDAELTEYTNYFIGKINAACATSIKAASKTLFVFAAANDGTDNDAMPVAPANNGAENTIVVAATMGVSKLASFSNYGATSVDVAAPGVVINSTIPGDMYMELSGTSMAAPAVTEIAALVKDANPALTAVEIKRVLVETVDIKDYLAGKVKSSGIVNTLRAVSASQMSKTEDLTAAIAAARSSVPDITEVKGMARFDDHGITPVSLPSLIQ